MNWKKLQENRWYRAWMAFAEKLQAVIMTVLFTALFLLIVPFKLIRLSDPLRFRLGGQDSYWEPHKPHEASLDRMRRLF